MSAVLTGLDTTASYYVTFFIGARLTGTPGEYEPYNTSSTVQLTYGSQTLWTSVANLSDSNGYLSVQTQPFTPSVTQATLSFTVSNTDDRDHSILIDALAVNQVVYLQPSTFYDFESPAVYGWFDYNSPTSAVQPWSWRWHYGGVAGEGGPFDPPGSDTPPHGTQVGTLALTCTVVNPQRCHAATAQTALSPLVLRSSPHVCSRPALLCSLCSALLCSALLCSALPMCRVCSRCSTRSFRCHPATVCSRMCRR